MAPSSTNPSNLHRAPVACHRCRAAKVRCLVSLQPDRCDRCITINGDCVFTPSKRSRARAHPYLHRRRPTPVPEPIEDRVSERLASQLPSPSPSSPRDSASVRPLPTTLSYENPHTSYNQQPLITAETRARIVSTLASLRGKRGAPFSFVTSGDRPPFGAGTPPGESVWDDPQQRQQSSQPPQLTPPSLKLSWLLCPLKATNRAQADRDGCPPTEMVKMPSYLSSMALCQTVSDPIEAGILTRAASMTLFTHFMIEMNTKWEYILDPHLDFHDSVRQRSRLLFATILFCSSKFATYSNSNASLVLAPEPFLQNRLCSLARSLAIKAFAKGDRSIETMQALYLLVCWKDADDDISYLHSGYAFRVLNDLDLERSDGDEALAARRMRTWLALFRQDKQQSLFFIRRAPLSLINDDHPSIGSPEVWVKNPHALPLDFVAGCSADLRRIQSRLRGIVQKVSSPALLPCFLELMDSELSRWNLTWKDYLQGEGRLHPNDDRSLDQRLLRPGKCHLQALMGLWGHSVRLNIASAIFRQALIASVASSTSEQPPRSLGLDIPTTVDILSPGIPGLASSIEGAFGTLKHILAFPVDDLRRAPDSVLLLGPSAALFLCLLLGFQCNGLLGLSFQGTAISLIQDVSRHIKQSIRSPQDTVKLHSTYLDSLVDLLTPTTPQHPPNPESSGQPNLDAIHSHPEFHASQLDYTALQAAQVLEGEMGGPDYNLGDNEGLLTLTGEPEQILHMQSVVNLLDADCFWEVPPLTADVNT